MFATCIDSRAVNPPKGYLVVKRISFSLLFAQIVFIGFFITLYILIASSDAVKPTEEAYKQNATGKLFIGASLLVTLVLCTLGTIRESLSLLYLSICGLGFNLFVQIVCALSVFEVETNYIVMLLLTLFNAIVTCIFTQMTRNASH